MESDLALAEEVLKLKTITMRMFDGWVTLRNQLPEISDRLRFGTSHRDKNAHQRAYRDLYSAVKKQITKMPDRLPEISLFEKPKAEVRAAVARTIRGDAPIPLANQAGTIFMGCPRCDGWVDVTKVFTEHIFDGIYRCEQGHQIFFGGIDKKKVVAAVP